MNDIPEALGDLAHGALTARSVEPAAGVNPADDAGHTHERACLNCGTALHGNHCHACGQHAHVHRTLGAFFHDLVHGVFHFEGKIWRTLPLLVWHPGRLTREYIDGRRASYVSPIALFLFTVFLTFAVFNLTSGSGARIESDASAIAVGAAQAETDALVQIDKLEADLAKARGQGQPTAALEGQLSGQRRALEAIRVAKRGELPKIIASSDGPDDAAWARRINAVWQHARENPALLVYKLQSSAYKYSWLLIPLSVPFLWLLFPFSRRFHLYDHTVFVTYSLSFMLLLLGAASLAVLGGGVGGALVGALLLYAPFHIYRQLREAYGLTRLGAWWRTWFLTGFAFVALTLFAVAVVALALG